VNEEERAEVAAELARARDEARAQARASGAPAPDAGPTPDAATPRFPDPAAEPATANPPAPSPPPATPAPPDTDEVNERWRAEGGGALGPLLERLLGGRLEAQRDWNAAQVRLDNEMLRWVEARFAATHSHYDALLGALGRRLDEADERHRRLEQELVGHVREILRRLELVAAEAVRGRAGLELQLDDLRSRLEALERALARRP
jgi:hypothetical protein